MTTNGGIPITRTDRFVRASCELGHDWVTTLRRIRVSTQHRRRPTTLQLSLGESSCPNCGRAWCKYVGTAHG